MQVFQHLLQHDDKCGPVTPKFVQQVAEHVARQAPFVDDPLLQRMKFSPTWCGKILRQFLSSGMPDAATRPRAPVVKSVSLENMSLEKVEFCHSNRALSGNVQPALFFKISTSL